MHRRSRSQKKRTHKLKFTILVLLLVACVAFYKIDFSQSPTSNIANSSVSTSQQASKAPATSTTAQKPAVAVNECASNALPHLILVSISSRHLWACNGSTVAYDSAVITGMENLPADLTPTGTYHIYAKTTDTYLNGSDSTGSWHDYVYYWMPFLDNQYGVYGFHDATWRAANAFGNISPYSSNASHGCVEMPLATAKWLYGWASIGTTVTIQS